MQNTSTSVPNIPSQKKKFSFKKFFRKIKIVIDESHYDSFISNSMSMLAAILISLGCLGVGGLLGTAFYFTPKVTALVLVISLALVWAVKFISALREGYARLSERT